MRLIRLGILAATLAIVSFSGLLSGCAGKSVDPAPVTQIPVPDPASTQPPKAKDKPVTPASNNSPQAEVRPFTKEKYTLIGIEIGQPKESVLAIYGEPLNHYRPGTENGEVIQVDGYKGFTIGYSENNTVRWISVTSTELDALLNGVNVGSSMKQLIAALGEPDRQNSYQVNYIQPTENIILKLDIDPDTSIIQAISLFKN